MAEAGYERDIVFAFFGAYGVFEGDQLVSLNGFRVNAAERDTINRWRNRDVVPLARLDTILMRHGMMTFEVDDYARCYYGRDGFVDPNAEPVEMVT